MDSCWVGIRLVGVLIFVVIGRCVFVVFFWGVKFSVVRLGNVVIEGCIVNVFVVIFDI